MWILTVISMVVAVAYVGSVVWKTGELPASVSACVYEFSERKALMCWTLTMWVSGICGLLPLAVKMGDLGWIGWLGMAGFGFLGVAPLIKGSRNTVHYIIGVATGVISQICVYLVSPWWIAVWLLYVPFVGGCMGAYNDSEEVPTVCNGKGVLLAEILCSISVWGAGLT